MNAFSRSWALTKSTFAVMRKDKEIFAFPIVAFFTSIVFLVLFAVLVIFFGIVSISTGFNIDVLGYILLFILYLGLGFINTFFSACVVYTSGVRFNNGNSTFGESLKNSFKKIDKIFLWAILSATIGLLLKILEGFARRAKGAGKLIFAILNSILSLAWSIATIFVVQAIMYNNANPFSAIKQSVLTLKKTWGESLIKYIGFGIIEAIFVVLGIIIFIPLTFIGFMFNMWVGIAFLILVFIYVMGVVMTFNIADQVYNTALFIYANTSKVPEGFNEEQMKEVFKPEQNKFGF